MFYLSNFPYYVLCNCFVKGVTSASILELIFYAFQHPSYSYQYNPLSTVDNNLISNTSNNNHHHKNSQTFINFYLRFSPDIFLIIMIIIVTKTGNRTDSLEDFLRNVGFEMIAIIMYLTLLFQKGTSRRSIVRFILESSVFRIIGYASYPIYLLHIVIIEYYFRMVYDTIIGAEVSFKDSYSVRNEWSDHFPMWWFFPLSLIIIVSICYLVQKYFQDTLIAIAWSRFLQRFPSTKHFVDL